MLNATIRKTVLEEALAPATLFNQVAELRTRPDGLEIYSTNLSRRGTTTVYLPSRAFDSFEASTMTVHTDVGTVLGILGAAETNPQLDANIVIGKSGLDMQVSNIDCKLGPPSDEYPNVNLVPESAPPVVAKFRCGELEEVKLADHINHKATLTIPERGRGLRLIAEEKNGDDFMEKKIQTEQLFLNSKTIRSTFRSDALCDLHKSIANHTMIQVSCRNDGPLVLRYSFANGFGSARIILRQKIDTSPSSKT
jgi:hypothetical protein